MQLRTGFANYVKVGEACVGPVILAGECAFQHCGLTTYLSDCIQAWTLYTSITGIYNPIVMWYFNPAAKRFLEDTVQSKYHPNIYEPTKERALIEYIMFHDYFDEGILIEGIKSYAFQMNNDYSKLYSLAPKYYLPLDWLDYWIHEAETDYDD